MKRLLFVFVVWGAALLPTLAQAQSRGMGFRGSAAPRSSGFGARPAGFSARPMSGARVSSFSARPATGVRFVSPRSRVVVSGRTFFPRNRFRFRNRFARNRFFFPGVCSSVFDPFCRNGAFFGGGFYDPFDPFYSGFTPMSEPQQPVVVDQDNGANRELALEVQELSDQIQSMRDEQRVRENRSSASARPVDDGPNTLLIFRDGLQLSVRNYAVAGDTVWVLDEHAARKIPVAKLDVPATEQANAKNGVEIHLPR